MLLRRAPSPLLAGLIAAASCTAPLSPPPHSTAAPAAAPATATAPATAPATATATAPATATAHDAQAKASPPDDLSAPRPPLKQAARITSQGSYTWVYGRPKGDKRFIGVIRYGQSVALRDEARVKGDGCPGGFFQIEPRGFVCYDHTVTLDPSPSFLASAAATAPGPGPFPYRYAFSSGAPMYNRVATAAEQKRFENHLGPAGHTQPLPQALSAHQDLAVKEAISPADPIPSFLENGGLAAEGRMGLLRQEIPLGSMLSFTRAFTAEGRTWLLSADQTVVPADRVRLFRPSAFHGVRLGEGVDLPLAWMRGSPKRRYHRLPSGDFEKTEETWPLRSFVRLTGASVYRHDIRYHETVDSDADGKPFYLSELDGTIVEALPKLPTGVAPDQKSIVVRITQGTLVAYEGRRAVYATLVSPGAGGVPIKGEDPVKASTTPLGTYYITFKDRATTMSPEKGDNRSFWIADVPHTQYFNPPFALHAAYWHERFGEPTSAGCVNLSPIDAEALFQWSDPQVPPDWEGATGAGAPENGPTTAIVIWR